MEHSLTARGDLWRVEASTSSSTGRDDSSSLFLLQLGPLLFLRDSTLLLPVHLSKQHLLWYGYDRKVCLDLQSYYLFSQWKYDCVAFVSLRISSVCSLFQKRVILIWESLFRKVCIHCVQLCGQSIEDGL